MKYEELIDMILTRLEVIRKGELTTEHQHMLHNSMREFFMKRKGFTDGEDVEDVVKSVISEMTIWVLGVKGVLVRDEVERQLVNKFQMVKDKAIKIGKQLEVYKLTPLMRLKTNLTPASIFEKRQLTKKQIKESQVKAVQEFWQIWDEMQHRTEPEWLFMKRLPITDPLWYFLGLVGMERFSIFFHDYEGWVFKMANDKKIERTMSLRKSTEKEFCEQVSKWFKRQASHNLFKK